MSETAGTTGATGTEPTGTEPTGIEPTDIEPTGIEPTDIEPTDIQATGIEPTDIQATGIEPTSIEPTGTAEAPATRGTPEMVVLTELADALIADLPHHPSGRTARTVLTGTVMRAVVIAIRDGAVLAEHDSPAAATLYVIKGRVTLRTPDREWPVYPGQLIPIPPQRHAVEAHSDSAFLLTVALH